MEQGNFPRQSLWLSIQRSHDIQTNRDIVVLQLVNGTKLGVLVMESRGFFPEQYWYWIGVGALFGFVWLFNILYLLCLTFLGGEVPKLLNFYLYCRSPSEVNLLFLNKTMQLMTNLKLSYPKMSKMIPMCMAPSVEIQLRAVMAGGEASRVDLHL